MAMLFMFLSPLYKIVHDIPPFKFLILYPTLQTHLHSLSFILYSSAVIAMLSESSSHLSCNILITFCDGLVHDKCYLRCTAQIYRMSKLSSDISHCAGQPLQMELNSILVSPRTLIYALQNLEIRW